jgi:hypothetical protein
MSKDVAATFTDGKKLKRGRAVLDGQKYKRSREPLDGGRVNGGGRGACRRLASEGKVTEMHSHLSRSSIINRTDSS